MNQRVPGWARGLRGLLWALLAGLICAQAIGQTPAPLAQPSLDLREVSSGLAVLPTGDGGAIVTGRFRFLGDQEHLGIAKLLPNGTIDPNWQVAVTGSARALALSGDRLFLAGDFTEVNGVARRGIAEVSLATGVLAPFNPNVGSTSPYLFISLAVGNGGLFVGGSFSQIGIEPGSNLAKIDLATGLVAPAFSVSLNAAVMSMEVAEPYVYIAGTFTVLNGTPRRYLAKLNATSGALDPWAPQFSDSVASIDVDAGLVYAAGCFDTVNGIVHGYLARVDAVTGATDNWTPDPSLGCLQFVHVAATQVYFTGPFSSVNGLPIQRLARISKTTGSVDAGFDAQLRGSLFGTAGYELSADRVLAMGQFITAGGAYAPGFALVDRSDGALLANLPVPAEVRGEVDALLTAPDGGTFVGGRFSRVRGESPAVLRRGLLKLDAGGELVPGFAPNPAGRVRALALTEEHLYVGGNFREVGAGQYINLARLSLDGTVDPSFRPHPRGAIDTSDGVYAMAVDAAAQTILIGGDFLVVEQGGIISNLAEIRFSGVPTAWAPRANRVVRALLVGCDGVYAGGDFTTVNGAPQARIAKLSRTGVGFAVPEFVADADATVRALLAGPNGTVYVGGKFGAVGGVALPALARLRGDSGGLDPTFSPLLAGGSVGALTAGRDGLYVAGTFDSVAGQPRQNLFRLTLDGTVDPNFAPALPEGAAVVVEQDSRVLVGGALHTNSPATETQIGVFGYPVQTERVFRAGFEGGSCAPGR